MSASTKPNECNNSRGTNDRRVIRGKEWTTGEVKMMADNAFLGAAYVSELVGRSISAVVLQAHRQGISLRTEGQRRGRLLGVPNGAAEALRTTTWLRDLRERVLAGETDPTVLVRRWRWHARGDPLCPSCASRPAETEEGWCRECKLREVRRVDEALKIADAQRENDRERQAKRQRATCPHCGYRMATREA